MLDLVRSVLSSPALGNLFLLIAAIIGVGGNLYLYWYKRKKEREKLRQALYSEIQSMKPVIEAMERQHDIVTMDPLDPRSFLVDSVYDSSSGDLGLLSESEVTALVEFYSTAISIQRVIGDDYHVAYEQVARRDLLKKANRATNALLSNGDFEIGRSKSIELGELDMEPDNLLFSK